MFGKRISKAQLLYIGLALLCLFPFMSPPIALVVGLIIAQVIENPFSDLSHKAVQWLLKIAVIGLGFGMSVSSALSAGKQGFLFTVASITLTLSLGLAFGKLLGIDKKIIQMISVGTAICGGSAIAALSPIIKADAKQISISIGIVFLLNSIALFIFPAIGHYLDLSQHQFGLWSAIAIHDTSSVIGAADVYGAKALEVATTVKLARALWILPISMVFVLFSGGSVKKIKTPYFIGLFILAIIANTYVPNIEIVAPYIVSASKVALTLVLFLIGTSLSFSSLKEVGAKPLFLAIGVWVFISVLSLVVILKTTF
ncbi:putative sulfate exporter family transporter [Gelidibacter salicanalis]|uniref:Sulfate exporter family transporter n=2 Tax=Gelidibacter salicanalis TaxID=291193 RepID=A0A934KXT4_9FLAO|nr:putative sulfate exporter family transporter [Gelidibacter salicanalis]